MTLPKITILVPYSGSVIDTSTIDGWRQGVEITLWKHFDAGIVKIRSGELGHRLVVLNRGHDHIDEFHCQNSFFTDVNNDNVVLSVIENKSLHHHAVLTRETGNGTTNETAGILEPFAKRRKFFMPIDGDGLPMVDEHDIKADTVIITSVFKVSNKAQTSFFEGVNPRAVRETSRNAHDSFSQESLRLTSTNFSSKLNVALQAMSPEDWDYLAPNEKTGSCGGFEDDYCGTNSISFSGLTY